MITLAANHNDIYDRIMHTFLDIIVCYVIKFPYKLSRCLLYFLNKSLFTCVFLHNAPLFFFCYMTYNMTTVCLVWNALSAKGAKCHPFI